MVLAAILFPRKHMAPNSGVGIVVEVICGLLSSMASEPAVPFYKLELRFDAVSDNKVEWLSVMLITEIHISLGTLGKTMICQL